MSIALESSNANDDRRRELPGFAHRSMACAPPIYYSTEFITVDQRFPAAQQLMAEDHTTSLSSSSTSSIGKNSDESTGVGGDGEEVQSEYNGGPLGRLNALEEVLPVKKSISKFYCGKSKSFTGLSDVVLCSSIKDITKPENAYSRKRKNLLAYNNFLDKNQNSISRNSIGRISKRTTNSRSMFTLDGATNCSDTSSAEPSSSNSSSLGCCLPPLPPHAKRATHCQLSLSPLSDKVSSWRSFSLSDLQGAALAEASIPSVTGPWINNSDK